MSDITHEPGGEEAPTDTGAESADGAPVGVADAQTGRQCPNGHAVKDGAAFCQACGARLGGNGGASAPPPPAPTAPQPAPGYGQPYGAATAPQPYGAAPPYAAPVQQQSTNGMAIASLVLGIVWVAGLGSLLAVIFGAVAKRQIRESSGRQSGGGMATAGIVLGIVGLAGAIIWFVLLAVAVNRVDNCLNNPTAANCGTTNTGSTGGSSSNSGNTGSGLGTSDNSGNSSNNVSSGSSGNTGTSNTGSTGTFNTGSTGVVSGFGFSAWF